MPSPRCCSRPTRTATSTPTAWRAWTGSRSTATSTTCRAATGWGTPSSSTRTPRRSSAPKELQRVVRSLVQSESESDLDLRRGPDRDEKVGPAAPARVHLQAVVLDRGVRRDRLPLPGRLGRAPAPLLRTERQPHPDGVRPGGGHAFGLAGGLVQHLLHHQLGTDGLAPPFEPPLRRLRDDFSHAGALLPGLLHGGLQEAP